MRRIIFRNVVALPGQEARGDDDHPFLPGSSVTPEQAAGFLNAVQELAEGSRLGIPVLAKSNARNHIDPDARAGINESNGAFTGFPKEAGLAADALGADGMDPVTNFARVMGAEWRAIGLRERAASRPPGVHRIRQLRHGYRHRPRVGSGGADRVGAGCHRNQLGHDTLSGFNDVTVITSLVEAGLVTRERVDLAAERLLTAMLRMGLFEEPYVDEGTADSVLSSASHTEIALDVQRRSVVLLQNRDRADGTGPALPLRPVRASTSWTRPADYGRPGPIVATFGIADHALLDVLTGEFAPVGRMPFALAGTRLAIEEQASDVPRYEGTTDGALFPYRHGLSYPGS